MRRIIDFEDISDEDFTKVQNFCNSNNLKYEKFDSAFDAWADEEAKIQLMVASTDPNFKLQDENDVEEFVDNNKDELIKSFNNDYSWIVNSNSMQQETYSYLKDQGYINFPKEIHILE